ncbi:MAG: hypothetical protein MHMPM18_000274 [Marteilia pararefringens]
MVAIFCNHFRCTDFKVMYHAVCIQDYEPQDADEMKMFQGNKLKVLKLEPEDPDWAEAYNVSSSRIGFIPLNHTRRIESPPGADQTMRKSVMRKSIQISKNDQLMGGTGAVNSQYISFDIPPEQIQSDINRDLVALNPYEVYEACYKYDAEQTDEMSFEIREMLVAVGYSREDTDWRYGYKFGSSPNVKYAFCSLYCKNTGKTINVPQNQQQARQSKLNFRASKYAMGGSNLNTAVPETKFIPPKLYECIIEYIAEDTDEMTIRPGHIIEAHGESVDDEWYLGWNRSFAQQSGVNSLKHFPVTCCKPYREKSIGNSLLRSSDGQNIGLTNSLQTSPSVDNLEINASSNLMGPRRSTRESRPSITSLEPPEQPFQYQSNTVSNYSKDGSIEYLERHLEALKHLVGDQSNKLASVMAKNELISNNLVTLKGEVDFIRTIQSKLETSINSLSSNSPEAEKHNFGQNPELKEIKQMCSTINSNLRQLTTNFEACESRVAKLKNTVVNQNAKIASLQSNNADSGGRSSRMLH